MFQRLIGTNKPLPKYDSLQEYYNAYWYRDVTVRTCMLAAAFFCFGGGIVIVASALCLTLPGTNVVTTMVLHGLLPGAAGFAIGTPFIVVSLVLTLKKKRYRDGAVAYLYTQKVSNSNLKDSPEKMARRICQWRKKIKKIEDKKKLDDKIKKKEIKKLEKRIINEKKKLFIHFNNEILLDNNGLFDRFWHKHFNASMVGELKALYKETKKCDADEVTEEQIEWATEMEKLLEELKMRVLNAKSLKLKTVQA